MNVAQRFLNYVKINSISGEGRPTVPTTDCQWEMARFLEKELREMGLADVTLSEYCYVYGCLPASKGCEELPVMGLIAHMDTSPECPGENVSPQIIERYDGGEVSLGNSGKTLSPKVFPHLADLKGQTLITSDGTTLLGADDKAGIAEILTALEEIQKEGLPHGKIMVGFTPDEEVGLGPSEFDIPGFGAEFAYTVDGGEENGVDYENFNAASAVFSITGFSVHPGSSKNTMKNAALLACELNAMLPAGDTPAHTEDREGFFHLTSIQGDVSAAEACYIIRDHDKALFEGRKAYLRHIESLMNEKYGEGTVSLSLRDQYFNMLEAVKPHFEVVEIARKAIENLGLTPESHPIRGGTDGATLSLRGLPCPNLGTGGHAAHGPYEHITVESMETMVKILKEIVRLHTESGK